jgi:hypothetical protein
VACQKTTVWPYGILFSILLKILILDFSLISLLLLLFYNSFKFNSIIFP